MTRRRILLWGLLVAALATATWGLARYLDARPNPVLVKVVPGSASAPSVIEVEVARARPIPMKVTMESMHGVPGSATAFVPTADADEVAAQERELRRALDVWLAEPGRGLKVERYWSSAEVGTGLLYASQRGRVVLHAQLVPVTAK